MENNGGGDQDVSSNRPVRNLPHQPPTEYSPPESSSSAYLRLDPVGLGTGASTSRFTAGAQSPMRRSLEEAFQRSCSLQGDGSGFSGDPYGDGFGRPVGYLSNGSRFSALPNGNGQSNGTRLYRPYAHQSIGNKFSHLNGNGSIDTPVSQNSYQSDSNRLPHESVHLNSNGFFGTPVRQNSFQSYLNSNGFFDTPVSQNSYQSNGNRLSHESVNLNSNVSQNSYQSNSNRFSLNIDGLYDSPVSGYSRGVSRLIESPVSQYPYFLSYRNEFSYDEPNGYYEGPTTQSGIGSTSRPINNYAPQSWNNPNAASSRNSGELNGGEFLESLNDGNSNSWFMDMAMSPNGSQRLRRAFCSLLKEYQIDYFVDEMLSDPGRLMTNPFGNHVVIKLMEQLNLAQRMRIVSGLTSNPYEFFCICVDTHGTRVVQKLVEMIRSSAEIVLVVDALAPFTLWLSKSASGHHVIQHCLRHFPTSRHTEKFLNEVANNCMEIATDKSGCCVLQVCVEHARDHIQASLLAEIIANSVLLSQDRYGNYVVQHILLMKIPMATNQILNALQGNFLSLSVSKYGSNVVEKCLKECDEEQARVIVLELLANPEMHTLFVDPYGNYVIKSALEVARGIVRTALIAAVEAQAQQMRNNIYGKKILDWFERRHRNNGP